MTTPKKVLVTGGCGYIGSVLLDTLGRHLEGHVIRIFDNLSGAGINGLEQLPLDGHYQFIEGDLLDPNQLDYALNDVDIVIHLAAKANTPLSFENPEMTRQVNQWGTTHLVDACLDHDVEHLIFASSAAVYGPQLQQAETDTPDPLGGYGSSKLAAEQYIRSKEGKLNYTIFRLGTVYGPSPTMRTQAFVNRLCFLAGTKKKLTVFGDGQQVRPVIQIDDVCRLFMDTLNDPDKYRNDIFNVCQSNCTILDVVEAITNHKTDTDVAYTDQDIRTRYNFSMNCDKITETGWQPRVDLGKGVKSVIDQFQGFEKVNTSMKGLL